MSIQIDIQALSMDALVELFVLDATSLGGIISRFHAGTNQLLGPVVWQGNTYEAMPIEASGFEWNGKGKLPRPSLRMQNVDGLIGALMDTYDDMIGAVVTRKRTFAKYLDAVNFPGGANPTADPAAFFQDDVYSVNRKIAHTKQSVELELSSSFDVHGVMIPRRQLIQHACTWEYRSAECSYAGPPVAKVDDTYTNVSTEDRCGKRIASCELRFGGAAVLPFGGFPGVGIIQR
jgi:lambda family phage minor tail protein L